MGQQLTTIDKDPLDNIRNGGIYIHQLHVENLEDGKTKIIFLDDIFKSLEKCLGFTCKKLGIDLHLKYSRTRNYLFVILNFYEIKQFLDAIKHIVRKSYFQTLYIKHNDPVVVCMLGELLEGKVCKPEITHDITTSTKYEFALLNFLNKINNDRESINLVINNLSTNSVKFALKLANNIEELFVKIVCESKVDLDIVPFVSALLSRKCSKLILSLEHSNIRISLVDAEKLIQSFHFLEKKVGLEIISSVSDLPALLSQIGVCKITIDEAGDYAKIKITNLDKPLR